jgi:hypothetical protein
MLKQKSRLLVFHAQQFNGCATGSQLTPVLLNQSLKLPKIESTRSETLSYHLTFMLLISVPMMPIPIHALHQISQGTRKSSSDLPCSNQLLFLPPSLTGLLKFLKASVLNSNAKLMAVRCQKSSGFWIMMNYWLMNSKISSTSFCKIK